MALQTKYISKFGEFEQAYIRLVGIEWLGTHDAKLTFQVWANASAAQDTDQQYSPIDMLTTEVPMSAATSTESGAGLQRIIYTLAVSQIPELSEAVNA